jgi:hypothetical protein
MALAEYAKFQQRVPTAMKEEGGKAPKKKPTFP